MLGIYLRICDMENYQDLFRADGRVDTESNQIENYQEFVFKLHKLVLEYGDLFMREKPLINIVKEVGE